MKYQARPDRPYIINTHFKKEEEDQPAVVKLHYENKYVVFKCKRLAPMLKNQIEKPLGAYIRGTSELNESNLYRFLFEYVKEHPDGKFRVEILLESDNAYELLKREQQELDAKNPDCLNWYLQAYIPEYNSDTQLYGWIRRTEYMNFKRWLSGRKKRKSKSAV